jgi:hypothetical protein
MGPDGPVREVHWREGSTRRTLSMTGGERVSDEEVFRGGQPESASYPERPPAVDHPPSTSSRVATNRRESVRQDPLRPFLGKWVVDAAASVAENAFLAENIQAAIRKEFEQNPVETEITRERYVSRSRTETIEDRYVVLSCGNGSVCLRLLPENPLEPATERIVRLILREGKLIVVAHHAPVFIVMQRSR